MISYNEIVFNAYLRGWATFPWYNAILMQSRYICKMGVYQGFIELATLFPSTGLAFTPGLATKQARLSCSRLFSFEAIKSFSCSFYGASFVGEESTEPLMTSPFTVSSPVTRILLLSSCLSRVSWRHLSSARNPSSWSSLRM